MLSEQVLPETPVQALDQDLVIARAAVRRIGWLRVELERDDVGAVPSLLAVYEQELASLEASPRLCLRAVQ